jgi:radical SAM protein with 4Fe4S-binding SPASM domain
MLKEFIGIELSNTCNLSCGICSFGGKVDKTKFISCEDYATILDKVAPYTKVIRLNSRGESTIHPDFVEILEYTKISYPQLEISLATNLSFVNNAIIKKFIEYDVQLWVSIDSPDFQEMKEIRGANLSIINNNVKDLSSIKRRPTGIFTLQTKNIHRIFEIATYFKENNMNMILNYAQGDDKYNAELHQELDSINDYFLEEVNKIKKLYENTGLYIVIPDVVGGICIPDANATTVNNLTQCPSVEKDLFITYKGDVHPCCYVNPVIYGNLLNDSFEDVCINSKNYNSFKKISHPRNVFCSKCTFIYSIENINVGWEALYKKGKYDILSELKTDTTK